MSVVSLLFLSRYFKLPGLAWFDKPSSREFQHLLCPTEIQWFHSFLSYLTFSGSLTDNSLSSFNAVLLDNEVDGIPLVASLSLLFEVVGLLLFVSLSDEELDVLFLLEWEELSFLLDSPDKIAPKSKTQPFPK